MVARWWFLVIGVAILVAGALLLWPHDPLRGVETIAIAEAGPEGGPPGIASRILDGLEIALEDHGNIRIVSDPDEADALLTLLLEEGEIRISSEGFRAHVPCRLSRDGQQHMMDLYVRLDGHRLTARLEPRSLLGL